MIKEIGIQGIAASNETARPNGTFERSMVKYGQLTLVNPFPPDYPPSFKDKLQNAFSRRFPTRINGKTFKRPSLTSRWVRKLNIDGNSVMLKGSRFSAERILDPRNDAYTKYMLRQMGGSILAQLQKKEILEREYREQYGENIEIEQPLGYFIGRDRQHPFANFSHIFQRDTETYQRFLLYQYYPQATVPPDPTAKKAYDQAVAKIKEQANQLKTLRSFSGNLDPDWGDSKADQNEDGIQYIITGNSHIGYRGIITDTELWTVGKIPTN